MMIFITLGHCRPDSHSFHREVYVDGALLPEDAKQVIVCCPHTLNFKPLPYFKLEWGFQKS